MKYCKKIITKYDKVNIQLSPNKKTMSVLMLVVNKIVYNLYRW